MACSSPRPPRVRQRVLRRLVGSVIAIGVGSYAISFRWRSQPSCPAGDETIVVVGAGIAGLGAAHALSLLACRVVVLEARDRIGGRTHTWRTGPFVGAEEGARWIHGGQDNVVLTRLFSLLGLSMHRTPGDEVYQSGMHSLHAWFANGTRLPKEQLLESRRAYERLERALDRHYRLRSNRHMADMAVGDAYDYVLKRAFEGWPRPSRAVPGGDLANDLTSIISDPEALRQLLAFHFRINVGARYGDRTLAFWPLAHPSVRLAEPTAPPPQVEGNFGADSRGRRGLSLLDTFGNAPYTDFYRVDKEGRAVNTDSVPAAGFGSVPEALLAALMRSPHSAQLFLGADGEVASPTYAEAHPHPHPHLSPLTSHLSPLTFTLSLQI